MGQSLTAQVQLAWLFLSCGVDYAGPIYFKQGSPRSKIQVKCYVICLVIKAVHLNWSTPDGCTAALWMLLTWRGKCLNMHSANGTTYAGAHHEVWKLRKLSASEAHPAKLLESANSEAFTSWGTRLQPAACRPSIHVGSVDGDQMFSPFVIGGLLWQI
jgi:hypothetical protein